MLGLDLMRLQLLLACTNLYGKVWNLIPYAQFRDTCMGRFVITKN